MLMSGADKFEQSEFQFHQQVGYEKNIQGLETNYLYHQGLKLPHEWVLLDNQSTIDVFSWYDFNLGKMLVTSFWSWVIT